MKLCEGKKYYLRENKTGREDVSCEFCYTFGKDALHFHFDVKDDEVISPYYIWKKMPANRFFQTMLMMPGMISGMVWTVIYKYFMDRAIPELLNLPFGPMSAPATQFITAVIYCYWLAVAGNMLIYTGTMSGISNELLDAGKVDGLRSIGEFWHIVSWLFLAVP